MAETIDERREWIIGLINAFVQGSGNDLRDPTHEKAWAEPLVGFASGADPIFEVYKVAVGDFHWTPLEVFSLAYPVLSVEAEELIVISWILPQTSATKAANAKQTDYPAERWARSRVFGEQFNRSLRLHVAESLTQQGYPAVSPSDHATWKSVDSEAYTYASTWSERHAAYAAGLGTFGLCDGLITPKGKAMRAGSVVARIVVPATPRPYTDHHAYCLFYSHGLCGKCIERCPVGAISEKGHNKVKCRAHLTASRIYVAQNYGFEGYGCGLCQTAVPCESGIPSAEDYLEYR